MNKITTGSSNPNSGSPDLKPGLSNPVPTKIQDPKQILPSGSSYSNQWTVSGGDKKPVLDPTLEAAKYWQRVKEEGFFPGKPKSGSKDQHAVESLDEFSEFDHNFANFQNFPSEHPVAFNSQPPNPFQHHQQGPPHIVYDRDHSLSYEQPPMITSYKQGPMITSYEHGPTMTTYDPQTISYDLDEDGPEKNALIYLSPHGPKVGNNLIFFCTRPNILYLFLKFFFSFLKGIK